MRRALVSSRRTKAAKTFSEIKTEGFKSLQENQKVSFEVKMGPKGKQAANIKPV
jgi:cold shock CspA family protein